MKTKHGGWLSRMTVVAVVALLAWGGTGTAWATDFTWDGNGDPNNGGNWSEPNNWTNAANYPGELSAADNATLPASGSARSVTVDVAVAVNKLTWSGGVSDFLRLNADMTVSEMVVNNASRIEVNDGRTLFVDKCNNDRSTAPTFYGSGRIVKQGINTFPLGPEDSQCHFTGQLVVSNGVVNMGAGWGIWNLCTNMTISSSGGTNGTFTYSYNQPTRLPLSFTISGPGYNNQGALRFSHNLTSAAALARPITVASAATIHITPTITVDYTGSLKGSETLTIAGGGHFKIMNGDATHDGMIVVTNATLSVPGALPSVTNITILTGGTLNGAQAHFPLATVVNNGGTWNSVDTASTWSGQGDGTNWSDPDNWFGDVPVSIEAIIPAGSSITVDAPSHVTKLSCTSGSLQLNADLRVDLLAVTRNLAITVNSGCTLFVDNNNNNRDNTPTFHGTGRIVKRGTATFALGPTDRTNPFSGELIVSNGTADLGGGYGTWSTSTNVTVCSSGGTNGTLQVSYNQATRLPMRLTLAGPGYNNQGALRWTTTDTLTKPITVQSDATTFISSGQTLTHTGALGGSGVMTLTGGGAYTMNNTWTYTMNGATGNGIVISTGTVNIAGCTLTIVGLDTATASEYVLVDYSSANGNLGGGAFAATNGLPETWSITYEGTTANPSAIVLSPPPRGTMIMLR